uniref:F-box domain-containing protein n=1 Tax=Leersia perrieri TaxID=77586 RepID=A0A0D9V173_9ORYZ
MRRCRKRKRAGEKPSCLPAAGTSSSSFESLNDDVLGEILVRLPSVAALARAACACARWRSLASSPAFLRRFRALHPSLLGHFATDHDDESVLPMFHPARSQFDDGCSDAAVRGGDFHLTHVDANAGWRLHDCRHGRLLFANERDLLVYDPLSRRGVSIRRPSWDPDLSTHFTHLLLADRTDSFRVVSVEHYGEDAARGAVYSSRTGTWRRGRWDERVVNPKRPSECSYYPGMQADGRVYWKNRDTTRLQVFDAGDMRFSYVRLPDGVHPRSKYAIGEAEDGACCLVCLADAPHGAVFKAYRLRIVGKGSSSEWWSWELDRRVPASLVIGKLKYPPVRHVCAVVAGVVLICFQNYSAPHRHVAFRLSDMKVEATLRSSGRAYPYLMPWRHSPTLPSSSLV